VRIVFLGGTGPIGCATAAASAADGDEFFAAHSGLHEGPADLVATHLHGSRASLLAPGGPSPRFGPTC
jgi:hypothetical protein